MQYYEENNRRNVQVLIVICLVLIALLSLALIKLENCGCKLDDHLTQEDVTLYYKK